MACEQLRAAMARATVTPEKLARKVGVDPKTVDRWVAGRLPHPRHRIAVAEFLDEDEDYLWPEVQSRVFPNKTVGAEIVSAYAYRSDLPNAKWWRLIDAAKSNVDLLGYTLYFLPIQHPRFVEELRRKCDNGCRIRIAIADPDSKYVADRELEEQVALTLAVRIRTTLQYLETLRECSGMEIRYQDVPLYNSIFRFDDQMLVTPHLYATQGASAPLLHLRYLGPNGLFSRFEDHFENVWKGSRPVWLERE